MFQPRIIGCLVVVGVLSQSPWLFVALSAVLWWSTIVSTHNPCDAIYNHVVAYPRGLSPLGVAPAPRRFAQGMAATFALAIGAALLVGAGVTARVLEALLVGAVMAVVFRDFCGPANLYHVLRGLASGQHSMPTHAQRGH